METRVHITAGDEHNKMRLEDFLLGQFHSLSKMYLRAVVKAEQCEVNGRWENRGYKLRPNDFVEITVDHTRGTAMQPQKIELDILFEDDELLIINKPEDMLMHPSHRDNSGTLLNALAFYLNQSEPPASAGGVSVDLIGSHTPPAYAGGSDKNDMIRPGLPHRLDRLTSGLVVVTKTARAHRIISGHFLKKRVEKLYLALVDGLVEHDSGTIDAPIGRFADIKFWGVKADGKRAVTNYKVRERYEKTTLLELEPVTGRTNQLRIHAAHIGHPIVGDVQRAGSKYRRLCLHAYRLAFPHPTTREMMRFEKDVIF
ncbi:MAG: RluA family pseudouridine synthase [Acidobacteria bacterium]|nr:RluA family pseudouridine synthase [Acidobacteriota bacterium]